MLVLSRRVEEKICFPAIGVTVRVVGVKGGRVRLGIEAPPELTILREELQAPGADGQGPETRPVERADRTGLPRNNAG